MSSINPHYRSIKALLQARSFSIDEYQREFKWDQQNIEELLNDLLAAFHASYQPGDAPRNVSDHHEPYKNDFPTEEEFIFWRNNVAGLLLLPADVNRSYQDKPYGDKVGHYAKQNLWTASLSPLTYHHQPQFLDFIPTV